MLGLKEDQHLKFKLKAAELVEQWQKFCRLHSDLYELTCDEYLYLLESKIDELESSLEDKSQLLKKITELDNKRKETIQQLGKLCNSDLQKFDQLQECLKKYNSESEAKQLAGYNALLLDIIEKIQEQNKKNQVFLNKAIISLNDLRQSVSGKKNYKTYGANGATKISTSP